MCCTQCATSRCVSTCAQRAVVLCTTTLIAPALRAATRRSAALQTGVLRSAELRYGQLRCVRRHTVHCYATRSCVRPVISWAAHAACSSVVQPGKEKLSTVRCARAVRSASVRSVAVQSAVQLHAARRVWLRTARMCASTLLVSAQWAAACLLLRLAQLRCA